MKLVRTALVATMLATSLSGGVKAERYTLTGWVPPTHVFTREMHTGWADLVREASKGEIDFEVFTGGALLPALGTLQGVATGVAQAGHITAIYHPSELPINNIAGELGFKNPDPFVLGAAYLDYATHDPAAYGEWHKNGIIPGATHVTEVYHLICRGEVQSFADLQGKRVRVPGGAYARWVADADMVGVNVPFNEVFSAMERGAVDCVASDTALLVGGASILPFVGSILKVPMGPGYATASIGYNIDFWKGLSTDQRRLLLDQTAIAMARVQIAFAQEAQKGMDAAVTAKVAIFEPDAETLAFNAEWNTKNRAVVEDLGKTKFGVEDPGAVIDTVQTYIDKWAKLYEGVDRTDPEAVAALLKENLFDKIDANSYGLE